MFKNGPRLIMGRVWYFNATLEQILNIEDINIFSNKCPSQFLAGTKQNPNFDFNLIRNTYII